MGVSDPRDPLLLTMTAAPGDKLLMSLRTAIASALAAPVIRQGGDSSFAVRSSVPQGLFGGARTAVVIGFGGYMAALAASRGIARLHVADLLFARRRAEMDGARQRFLAARPELDMTFSDGSDIARRMAGADLVRITGSARAMAPWSNCCERRRAADGSSCRARARRCIRPRSLAAAWRWSVRR